MVASHNQCRGTSLASPLQDLFFFHIAPGSWPTTGNNNKRINSPEQEDGVAWCGGRLGDWGYNYDVENVQEKEWQYYNCERNLRKGTDQEYMNTMVILHSEFSFNTEASFQSRSTSSLPVCETLASVPWWALALSLAVPDVLRVKAVTDHSPLHGRLRLCQAEALCREVARVV